MTDSNSTPNISIGQDAKGVVGYNVIGNTIIQEQQLLITPEAIELNPFHARSPYKALKRFDVDDSEYFFGRYQLTRELQAALETSNLILVLGASGSGKSSVVRAKLIPEFLAAGSHRHDFVLTPKDDPFRSLYESLIGRDKVGPDKNYCFSESQAQFVLEGKPKGKSDVLANVVRQLKDKDAEWLIFIDQFEELFTRCSNLEQRKSFIQSIAQIAESDDRSVKIVLAMRADFLGEFSPYPQFGKLVQRQIHLVNEMPADELELAIKGPAAKHGVCFEPGLAKEIIADVQGQAGSLPLMQYTLDRLWDYEVHLDKLTDRTLNTQNYQALGKVRGALEQHVNEIYGTFTTVEQQATKRIFLSLVKVFTTEGVEKRVSQSVVRSQLQGAAVLETIDRLINENLLVSSSKNLSQAALPMQNSKALEQQATIEIAHEILLTSWTKLQDWIQEAQATLLIKSRLVEDMGRWHEQKNANQELLKSSVLAKVVELKEKHLFELQSVPLSAEEETYIVASQKFQKQELNRARKVAVGASIGAVLMASAALVAMYQVQQAQRQRVEQLAANAKAMTGSQPVDAVITVIAAKSLSQTAFVQFPDHPRFASVEGSLLDVISINREQNQLLHPAIVYSVAFSPDGQHIVSGCWDGTVQIWDAKTGMPISKPLTGHRFGPTSLAFSADSQHVLSSDDRTVQVWDAKTGAQISRLVIDQQADVRSVAFSPNGQHIVTGRSDKTIRVLDTKTGAQIGKPLTGHQSLQVTSVAFSPDGQRIVSGSDDNTVRVWDVKTGAQIGKPLIGHRDTVLSVGFSPDGQRIVSGSGDKTVRIWDVKAEAQIGEPLTGHESAVMSVTFSPDSQRIISGGDKTVRVWDAKTGMQVGKSLVGHRDTVLSVGFSPDGQRIVSSSSDKTVRLWDAESKITISEPLTVSADVRSVGFSPDGQRIVSGSTDGAVRVWDAKAVVLFGNPLIGHEADVHVAFSPDSQHVVSGGWEGKVQIWDIKTGTLIRTLPTGHQGGVESVAFSPDGQRIFNGGHNTVQIWDVKTGTLLKTILTGHKGEVSSVAVSLDGQHIVSGGEKMVQIWDAKTGAQIGQSLTDDDATADIRSVAFSPDGQRIVSANGDANTVRIWNTKTGASLGNPLVGHEGAVNSVVFSPDGQRIISGSSDHTLRIWDVKTGEQLVQMVIRLLAAVLMVRCGFGISPGNFYCQELAINCTIIPA
jgi:WD40 repeat protein